MKCLCTEEQLTKVDKMTPSSESLPAKDYSLSGYSSQVSDGEKKTDTRNIEEAELSLRESSSLNYEVCFFILFSFQVDFWNNFVRHCCYKSLGSVLL